MAARRSQHKHPVTFTLVLIAIVPKAGSVEERFKALKKLRPRFSLPEKIMSFTWPRHIDTFRSSGLADRIETRLVSLSGDRMAPGGSAFRFAC